MRSNLKKTIRSNPVFFPQKLAIAGIATAGIAALALSGCVGSNKSGRAKSKTVVTKTEHINNETKFSSKEFGVAGSPRVTSQKRPRKGGGRFQIGKPYKVRGKWYKPIENPGLQEVGLASWYGPNFHGRLTANGEIYDQYGISAAHPTMPLPSYASVTNLENGRKITVRVNDRGPYAHGRVIDLSARAAELLGYKNKGVAKVRVKYVGRARMDGLDEATLLASYQGPNAPTFDGTNGSGSGTMIAMADTTKPVRAANAINEAFQPAATTLSGGIPVPIVRPTLFEGVPLASLSSDSALTSQIEQVVYRPTVPLPSADVSSGPKPMAYADNAPDFKEISYAYVSDENGYSGEYPDSVVRIGVGVLPDKEARELLEVVVKTASKLKLDRATDIVTLVTTEKHANQVLIYLHDIGLTGARIL